MKLLGYDINIKRASTAAEPNMGAPSVSIQKNLQKTEPSIPLQSAYPRADLGDSGTRLLHGIITEEYNPQLQGIQGIRVFDEMRKSDGTVRAAVLACTLPIRRAKFFINPVSADPKDKEVADFVQHAIMDWADITWDDILRQALLMVPFGVMLFEKVYGIKNYNGKDYVTLSKLAPRLPKSILQWELPDHTFGIQQIRQDGVLAMIPGSKLLIFVNEREGDNWWGNSMLRAAYKHWYFKNNFYKIDAIAMERQAIGVPMIKMPPGYTTSDQAKAATAAQNLRASESAYLLLPSGYEAEFMDMGSHTTRDPKNSIDHHNKEILQSVLAQFLELGQTSSSSGSRATSEDHSDLFLKAMEALANTIVDEFNKNLIPELVNLNFSDVDVYPVLDYAGISKVDVGALANAYSSLVTAGAISPTDGDQQYLRAAMGLPPRTQEEIDAADEDLTKEELKDGVDIVDTGADAPPGKEDTKKVDTATKNTEEDAQTTKNDEQVDTSVKKKSNPKPPAKASEPVALTRTFSNRGGFMSWRPLTLAEEKVNFARLQAVLDDMEKSFGTQANQILTDAKDSFMAKLIVALRSQDTATIQMLEIQFIAEYKALLRETMNRAYNYGKQTVSAEMHILPPPSDPDTIANMELVADTIANKTLAEIESKAKLGAANAIKNDVSALQGAGEIDADLEATIEKSVDNIAGTIIAQNINAGRYDVFERNADEIYALQRSEILDDVTCNFCLSMDGRVITLDDDFASTDIYHTNCRGIWVQILKDEKDPPEIGGIPDSLANHYDGQTNQLTQPPRPITKPGSLAEKAVKKQ